jgi:acetyl-CoA carboxylase biotin carboxylase subunit
VGIIFVGPGAKAMEQMGDKIAARKTATTVNVPVIPGTETPVQTAQDAAEFTRQNGFPVMVKAAAGGGGKGMRLVERLDELASAVRDAQAEAQAAFGDSSVYLEKVIRRPRHIEFQILADRYGNVVHLGERECSIQRRHQKVIEESPSPFMSDTLRQQMGESAVRIARTCGYQNAGTIEFLVDAQGNYYFLEMNTRLQVEHPVTEMVTGIDLVKEQFRIASGEKLGIRQEDIRWTGHALECRVYAEDPQNDFFPSPGRITVLKTPSGPGVRDESGIYEGWTVPVFYDPLLSKLVTWGRDRAEAINRMQRALGEYQISGIRTNLSFFRSILAHEKFLAGELATDFIDKHFLQTSDGLESPALQEVAVIAAVIHASQGLARPTAATQESAWKRDGRLDSLRR